MTSTPIKPLLKQSTSSSSSQQQGKKPEKRVTFLPELQMKQKSRQQRQQQQQQHQEQLRQLSQLDSQQHLNEMEQKAIALLEDSIKNYKQHVEKAAEQKPVPAKKKVVVPEAPKLPGKRIHEESTRFGSEGEELSYFEPYI